MRSRVAFTKQHARAATASLGVLAVGAVLFTVLSRPQESAPLPVEGPSEKAASPARAPRAVLLRPAALPLEVSGVVRGVEEVVVRARASGVVEELPAREGMRVRIGDLLARQEAPEARAALTAAQARRALTKTQQELAEVRARSALSIALLSRAEAEGVAGARREAAGISAETSVRVLLASVDEVLPDVIAALDFIDNQKYLFNAAALSSFQDATYSFFGYEPTFLSNGSLRGAPEDVVPQEVARRLEELRQEPRPSARAASRVAALTALQLRAAHQLLIAAEPEVLATFSPGDSVYDTYYAVRARTAAAAGALERGMGSAVRAEALNKETSAREGGTVAVREEEAERARAEAEYAARIARHMDRVQEALVQVSAARLSLTETRAPFSGVVMERYVKPGAYVREGEALLRLAGAQGRELVVQVPFAFAAGLRAGQPLVRQGAVIGWVDRFSPSSTGGIRVFITLGEGVWQVGEALRGTLSLEALPELYAVPRAYVWFDSEGPLVRFEDGGEVRVTVVYDTPEQFFVRAPEAREGALVPFGGAARP